MTLDRRTLLASLGLAVAGLSVMAAADPDEGMQGRGEDIPVKPGVIYAIGEKRDGGFNEGALHALEFFRNETGDAFLEAELPSVDGFAAAADGLISQGANPVIAVGFYYADAVKAAAAAHPETRFVLVDGVADGPNIRSIVFREQEGAYLVGVLAALASKSGTIGFVGAADIPLMQKFSAGYAAGARATRPGINTLVDYVGTDTAAFRDRDRATLVARGLIGRGADVLFAVAGQANLGVFQAARDAEKLAIGVDSNQNGVVPGTILTSMLKRVDIAVLRSLDDMRADTWKAGLVTLGVREHAVGWAIDQNNRPMVTPAMEEAVETARRGIADGAIIVPDPTAP
ncbi:MAG: BMP family ABC transporter substrate-binding protein [Inquilinus limosus]|uniref:BMP family ABC transporter substrate-binding protein n=1 Tax=Inquilinus limosus TaxID=171674 RepID=A0A952FQP5_9PROT|nr:BMP family ABC transporter substrate-binding protein [Inquilinus limosus]